MTSQIFEKNLKKMFKESSEIDYVRFVLDRYYCDHVKMVRMAGDLGNAFSQIGDLTRSIAELK